jgi:hypothetical protein
MLTLDEIARQLTGAWKMAVGAQDWRERLGRSTDDVFRSFYAFVLSTPLSVTASVMAWRAALKSTQAEPHMLSRDSPVPTAAVDLVATGLVWVTSLALLLAIARQAGRTGKAADIVAGWNWLQPITIAIGLPVIALASAGLDLAAAGLLLGALAISIALYLGYVRRAFDASISESVGILIILIMIEVIATYLTHAIAQSVYGPA